MENKNNHQISEYGELAQFVAEKFDELKGEIKGVKDVLKEEIKGVRDELKEDLRAKADKSDIDRVLTRVVMLGDKIDDYRAEQLTTQKQVDAHEKWIAKAAPKIGVEL